MLELSILSCMNHQTQAWCFSGGDIAGWLYLRASMPEFCCSLPVPQFAGPWYWWSYQRIVCDLPGRFSIEDNSWKWQGLQVAGHDDTLLDLQINLDSNIKVSNSLAERYGKLKTSSRDPEARSSQKDLDLDASVCTEVFLASHLSCYVDYSIPNDFQWIDAK